MRDENHEEIQEMKIMKFEMNMTHTLCSLFLSQTLTTSHTASEINKQCSKVNKNDANGCLIHTSAWTFIPLMYHFINSHTSKNKSK